MVTQVGHRTTRLVSGLDLGPVHDFTAWVVVGRTAVWDDTFPGTLTTESVVRYAERFPPDTAYGELFASLRQRYLEPPLRDTAMAMDQIGVVKPVMKLLRRADIPCRKRRETMMSGTQEAEDGVGGRLVPKKDLAELLQVMLHNRTLKIPASLEYDRELADELQHFRMKPQPLGDGASADASWRERPHDDLVLALALACRQAEKEWVRDEWLDHECVPRSFDVGSGSGDTATEQCR